MDSKAVVVDRTHVCFVGWLENSCSFSEPTVCISSNITIQHLRCWEITIWVLPLWISINITAQYVHLIKPGLKKETTEI